MRITFGVLTILAGVGGLGLGGLDYWQCFVAADQDLSEAKELKRLREEVQRRADLRQEAIREVLKKPTKEQIAADPEKHARQLREVETFHEEWGEILRRTDEEIQEKSTRWRWWHFAQGSVVLIVSLGAIAAGVGQLRRPAVPSPQAQAEPGTARDTAT